MQNAEQLNYRELNPVESTETGGGFDPFSLLAFLVDTVIDMANDPNCGCNGGEVYYP